MTLGITAAAWSIELAAAEPAAFIVPKGFLHRVGKRGFDLIVGSLLLILALPLVLVAAALIWIEGGRPVIFKQMRAGLDGRPFQMYKFRSMRVGAELERDDLSGQNEQNGITFKIRHDPRITRIGRFLRRSSIDELPQLINVLKGEMSLVGPRPLWMEEARQASGAALARSCVKPGLTCLWQISGRSELSYNEWVVLDLYYIRHRSLLLDFLILLQTIPPVLSGRGAY